MVKFILYIYITDNMIKINQNEIAKEKKYLEQNKASLEVLEANRKIGDHTITFDGDVYKVNDKVFSPLLFNGWRTFTKGLSRYDLEGKNMVEIGAGSGITALHLLLKKRLKSVTLSDITESAVKNSQENAELLGVSDKVKVLKSDVFDSYGDEKFDIIYWNCPWAPVSSEYKFKDEMDYGLFDKNNVALRKYFDGINERLTDNGKAFIAHADFGEIEILKSIAEEKGLEVKLVLEEPADENGKVTFELYEILKKEK